MTPTDGDEPHGPPMTLHEAMDLAQGGVWLRRLVKGRLGMAKRIGLSDDCSAVSYYGNAGCWAMVPNKPKAVDTKELLEVRSGWHSDGFHKASRKHRFVTQVREDCCLSIIFRHRVKLQKSVDFVASSSRERDALVNVVNALVARRKEDQYRFNDAQWLHEYFTKADTNGDGSLEFHEIWSLLQDLQLEISEESARKLYEELITRRESSQLPLAVAPILASHVHLKRGEVSIDKEGFVHFFEALTTRQELVDIIKKYSAADAHFLTPTELQRYLHDQGYLEVSESDCIQLVTKHAISDANKRMHMLGPSGFRSVLLTRYGDPLVAGSRSVYQDMTRPLAHYYMYGSHNTYLTGHQLRGDASVEGYISALNKGVKLLELDVWDGDDNRPIITHGHTLVYPITFRSALRAIKKYAFALSPFPVVLSIENHCSVEQQRVMADIFKDELGDMLYTREKGDTSALPSPQALSYKFLLKGKVLPADADDDADEVSAEEDDDTEPVPSSNSGVPPNGNGDAGGQAPDTLKPADDSNGRKRSNSKSGKKVKHKLARELSDIISVHSVKLRNPAEDLASHPECGMPSVPESAKFVDECPVELAAYTRAHLVKVYPGGLRTDSSNFDPLPHWAFGAQCASMNVQTSDLPVDLCDGMFQMNGQCGYVLKPDYLLSSHSDPVAYLKQEVREILEVTVVSGQCLPKPDTSTDRGVVDPYVSVELFVPPQCDHFDDRAKTTPVRNNGFNPMWGHKFEFALRCAELALVRFVVKDYDMTSTNEFIAEAVLPVTVLRDGYSHVRLRTGYRHMVDACASLFVHCFRRPV